VPLTNWIRIPAVLVAWPTAMQNMPFSSIAVAITITNVCCAYPWWKGQAEWTWVAGYIMVYLP